MQRSKQSDQSGGSLTVLALGRRGRWIRAVAAIGAIAAIMAPVASAAPSASHLVAQACAGRHSVSAALNASDYGLLRRFVPCVLLDFLGHPAGALSSSWNRFLATTMVDLERAPKQDDTSSFVTATVQRVAHPVLSRIEPNHFHDCAKFSMREGDTTPPPITLASVAAQIQLAVSVIPSDSAWKTWAFYVGHRPIFHDGPRNNISWAVAGAAGATGC
jgi:hypothetical protein